MFTLYEFFKRFHDLGGDVTLLSYYLDVSDQVGDRLVRNVISFDPRYGSMIVTGRKKFWDPLTRSVLSVKGIEKVVPSGFMMTELFHIEIEEFNAKRSLRYNPRVTLRLMRTKK
jgi:hypothetical protein